MRPRLARITQPLRSARSEAYVCPSCALRAATTGPRPASTISPLRTLRSEQRGARRRISTERRLQPRRQGLGDVQAKRLASHGSLASATAINAPSTVPPALRDLHQKLLLLEGEAADHVSLSRLQLALRSLEGDSPVVRVALLGLGSNGALAARKLARVLLSDALGDEGAWEHAIVDSAKDARSLLVRYGDVEDAVVSSPLMQTMSVPSPFLKRHNVEILVSTINSSANATDVASEAEIEDAILVPSLATPASSGGRVGFVRYPVHKALVVAEGITGAVEYGRLPRFVDKATLINSALSLPLRSSTGEKTAEQTATDNVVDIDLATHALKLFRTSKANGAKFSEEWQTSRLPALSKWIAGPEKADADGLRPAVRSLLDSVLFNTSIAVERIEAEQRSAVTKATVPDITRTKLNNLLSHWSGDWHTDLQQNLTTALQSRNWKRTAWWRLLWRVDDVSVSAADVLRLSWLVESEQCVAFLSGRIAEAGLASDDELRQAGAPEEVQVADADGNELSFTMQKWQPKAAQVIGAPPAAASTAELFQTQTLFTEIQKQSGINPTFIEPWPQTIHVARQRMLHALVPSMHRKAQALLLQTLSTITGTSALGIWLYIATSGAAIQGAGAIAALGLAWSLRRLQTLWGKERESFAGTLREDGRRALAEVEGHLRSLIKEGGRARLRNEDVANWVKARTAIESCREALEKIR